MALGPAGATETRAAEEAFDTQLLLDDLVAGAGSGVRVLRTQGVESEAPLPFAALHRLLRPVLGLVDRIPAPQAPSPGWRWSRFDWRIQSYAVAILAVFGMIAGAPG